MRVCVGRGMCVCGVCARTRCASSVTTQPRPGVRAHASIHTLNSRFIRHKRGGPLGFPKPSPRRKGVARFMHFRKERLQP